jgi:hypothetical protein
MYAPFACDFCIKIQIKQLLDKKKRVFYSKNRNYTKTAGNRTQC